MLNWPWSRCEGQFEGLFFWCCKSEKTTRKEEFLGSRFQLQTNSLSCDLTDATSFFLNFQPSSPDWTVSSPQSAHRSSPCRRKPSSGTFGWLNGAGQDLAREGEGEPALLKDYLKRRRMRSLEFLGEAAETKQHRSSRLQTAGGAANLLLIAFKKKKKKSALWLVSRPEGKIFYETLSSHKVAILPLSHCAPRVASPLQRPPQRATGSGSPLCRGWSCLTLG